MSDERNGCAKLGCGTVIFIIFLLTGIIPAALVVYLIVVGFNKIDEEYDRKGCVSALAIGCVITILAIGIWDNISVWIFQKMHGIYENVLNIIGWINWSGHHSHQVTRGQVTSHQIDNQGSGHHSHQVTRGQDTRVIR